MVYNFPEYAQVSHLWYMDSGWELVVAGQSGDRRPRPVGKPHRNHRRVPHLQLCPRRQPSPCAGDAVCPVGDRVGAELVQRRRRGQGERLTPRQLPAAPIFLNACLSHLRSLSDALPLCAAGFLLLIARRGRAGLSQYMGFPALLAAAPAGCSLQRRAPGRLLPRACGRAELARGCFSWVRCFSICPIS